MKHLLAAGLLAATLAHAADPAKDVGSTAADREAVAVTVYNDDLALVKERRKHRPAGRPRAPLAARSGGADAPRNRACCARSGRRSPSSSRTSTSTC
jgi:hypothetical protein